MDMLYSDYVDMVNSLMIQVFLHECGVKDADPDVIDDYFDEYFEDGDEALIDEA